MHLIVVLDPAEMAAWASGRNPQVDLWNAALSSLQPSWCEPIEEDALHDASEHALARLVLGRSLRADEDGQLPLTGWRRSQPEPWGCLTPAHGLVGSDRITLVPPSELALDAQESRSLFEAVLPLFLSEGVELQWHSALQWHARHDSLRRLPCASVGRVSGDSVQRWQGRTPLAAARLMRRLQNEAQMVLHGHPVNHDRHERGLLPVNTLWLSACGQPGDLTAEPPLTDVSERLGQTVVCSFGSMPLPPDGTRDLHAALETWLRSLPEAAAHSAAAPHLVLCSASRAQAFVPAPPATSGWARWRRRLLGDGRLGGGRPLTLQGCLQLLQNEETVA